MNASHDLDRRIAALYASEAPTRAPDWLLASALETIETTPQRHEAIRAPWQFPALGTSAKLAIVAAALIAIAAIGLAVGAMLTRETVVPRIEPLTWTPERYAQDWPGPLRPEPALGGAPYVLLVRGPDTHWDPGERAWEGLEHVDPIGDAGPGGNAEVDIRKVGGGGAGIATYSIKLADGVPLPPTDPANRWIAYGIVVDTNADGIADERVGIDNMPDGSHRAWSTDLVTGRTKWKAGPGYGSVYDDGVSGGSLGLDTWYPSARDDIDGVLLRYSGGSGRYYAWASMIEDGRVVATDFAPDVGWLVAPADPGLPLIGTTWTIEREIPSRSLTVMMWLIFKPDGQLTIELCKRGDATAQVTPGTIRVTDIALAGDACSAEVTEMEAEILALLMADEISYTLDAGVLELRAGPDTLRLQGSPDPPPG